MSKLYLAGPIADCTWLETHEWREVVKRTFGADQCLDPTRREWHGPDLSDADVTDLVHSDKDDIAASDGILAYCWKIGVGTSMEVIYAHSIGKPAYVVVPDGSVPSPWYRYHATEIFPSMAAALVYLQPLFARSTALQVSTYA